MKKKVLMMMVALATLCACDSEMMTEEQIETQSLAASKVEKANQLVLPIPEGYSALGIIPKDALAKMSAEEKAFWEEMSKTFYIDYSVLENVAYTKDKKNFMQRWKHHIAYLKEKGIVSSFLVIPSMQNTKHRLTRLKTSAEISASKMKKINETVYSYMDLTLNVVMSYYKKNESIIVESGPFLAQSSEKYLYDGQFWANVDRTILDVYLEGKLYNKLFSKQYIGDVAVHTSIYL